MNSRIPSRKTAQKTRTAKQNCDYQNLEPRNLLAGMLDSADAAPTDGPASLVYALTETQPVQNRIDLLRAHLDLGQNEGLQLISLERDQYGFAHFKYQQMYNQVPVESAVYSVHVRDRQIVSLSGDHKEVSNVALTANLTEGEAFQSALDHVGATTYLWQVETVDENGEQRFHANDESLHEIPEGELVYYTDTAGEVSLAYKFDVYAVEPFSRSYIYVDASSGTIQGEMDRIRHIDAPASGTSLYNGDVDFTGDTNGFAFRLRNSLIGAETLNMNNGFIYGNAIDYVSFDNVFDEPENQTGVQAHWGAEQTLAFYSQFGRLSWDGMGTPLVSYVSFGINFEGAFWDGSSMTFGDGDGTDTSPFVSLDIVGHEVSHGLTDTTAGLVNMNEPGALSESFSDIFGEAIENFATGTNNWLLEHEVGINSSGAVRSMADPKLFNSPDTYLGENWWTSPGDNGGIHTNSGVQNKWFYLMSEGGAGTNDNGLEYDIAGLGIDEATQIAWRNLTVYLTPDSGYGDAREGAIQSAIDLYGEDSTQHLMTIDAWEAVGVSEQLPDFQLVNQVDSIAPSGSLIHYTTVSGTHDGIADVYFGMNLDANQTLNLRVEGAGDLVPSVRVINSALTELADVDGDENVLIVEGVPAQTAGLYVFGVQSDVPGDFTVDVWLNASLEHETYQSADSTNDTLETAQDIDSSAIKLAGRAQRLAVLGDLSTDDNVGIAGDDFESGSLGEQWTTSSTDFGGRIIVTDSIDAATGTFSLLMDQSNEGTPNLNEAILTFDLLTAVDPVLSFAHAEFNDETNVLPDTYEGSFDGDGVSVSPDGITWYTILTGTDTNAGEWTTETFDMTAVAADLGFELTQEFQIKFQQFDNFRADTDGRAYDDIQIIVPASVADWYSFGLRDGQFATAMASSNNQFFQPGTTRVDIFNAAGDLILAGSSGVEGTSFASQFVGEGETYYARVSGTTTYSLVITRGADFDNGSNNGDADTQVLLDHQGVLGHISLQDDRGAEPDDAFAEDDISNRFPGVTLSNETTGGSVFAADASAFGAPTGERVFAPTAFQANGWRENINEFRADFAIPKTIVSVDFGSDDDSDVGRLRAYDIEGTYLGEMLTDEIAMGEAQTLTFTRPTPDISYVIATGVGGDVIPIDNLVFEGAVSDPDVYSLAVFNNQQIDLSIVLPGGGDGLFENGLVVDDGPAVNLELLDPSGKVVATGNETLSHFADQIGLYEVRVVAQPGFAGEYFLYRDIDSGLDRPVGIDFGLEDSTPFGNFDLISTEDYSFSRGYGWLDSSRLNPFVGARGNELVRDGVSMRTGTFAFDVDNGVYDIEVYLGVVTGKIDGMTIAVEGVEDVFTPLRGPNIVRAYTTNVTDGQLTISFDGSPGLDTTFRLAGIGLNDGRSQRSFVGNENGGLEINTGNFETADNAALASARIPGSSNVTLPEVGVSTIRPQTPSPFAASGLMGSKVIDHRQHDEQFANWDVERQTGDLDSDLEDNLDFDFVDELLFDI